MYVNSDLMESILSNYLLDYSLFLNFNQTLDSTIYNAYNTRRILALLATTTTTTTITTTTYYFLIIHAWIIR